MNTKKLDLGGLLLSVGCLLHCVLLPYLLTSITVLGIDILENIYVELCLILSAGVVGGLSFFRGKRQHKKMKAGYVFMVGFLLLVSKLFFKENEWILSIFALLAMSTAHIWNYFLSLPTHNHDKVPKCSSCSLPVSK